MNTDQIEFRWSDAWLLQAIALAANKGPATLKDIVANGDAINHAIFTFAELQTGLAKLLTAGYIKHEDDSFSLTSTFAEEFTRLSEKDRSIGKQREAIEEYLHATPWQPGYDPSKLDQNWSYPGVTREGFNEAVQEYIQSSRSNYRGRKKKSS